MERESYFKNYYLKVIYTIVMSCSDGMGVAKLRDGVITYIVQETGGKERWSSI